LELLARYLALVVAGMDGMAFADSMPWVAGVELLVGLVPVVARAPEVVVEAPVVVAAVVREVGVAVAPEAVVVLPFGQPQMHGTIVLTALLLA
jgi:hypothetical protein